MSKNANKSLKAKTITPVKEPAKEQPKTETAENKEQLPANLPKLPPEMEKKLKALKEKLDGFKGKVLEKFGDYIIGIALLPPEKVLQKPEEATEKPAENKEKEQKDDQKINLLVLVDDTTSQKMTKEELHEKFSTIIKKMAEETDKNLAPQCLLLTDLWQNCYDAKYELNKLISLGAPIHDNGMLAAIKIAEVHKTMILKKFDKYILSYVLAGSLTQGKATHTSDIDVWITFEDEDIEKLHALVEALEDNDEVQEVYTNAE